MKTRTAPRAAMIVAATALAVGALPTVANAASNPTGFASLGYLTFGRTHTAATDKLWATAPASFGAGTLLTPTTYAYSYDVSDDGDTLVVAGQSRALTAPKLNTTFGMLLVERSGPTTTTTSIATVFDSNPVISPDGAFVYWLDSGKLWKYDVAAKTTATVASTNFAPAAGEGVGRLAVSPLGTAAAVVYTKTSGGGLVSSRIKVGRLDGVGTEFSYAATVASGNSYPVGSSLAFTNNTQVAFNVWRSGILTGTWAVSSIGATPSLDKSPGIGAVYDLGTDGANWYAFQDLVGGTQASKSATPFATGTWQDFPLGTGTTRYLPSAATPPVAAATIGSVANRATATSYLFLAKSVVPTGTKVMFASLAAYLTDSTGTRGADVKAQTRYGKLNSSTDGGTTWSKTVQTGAGSKLLTWPTGAPFGNGYTAGLTRNTWFQWCFEGDAYVKADCTVTKKVTVNPTVSIGKQKLGTSTRVYGKAARVGGTAVLSRFVSGKWVAVATAPVSSTGTFSFGFRTLVAGSYKAVVKADASWGSGLKQFSI
jgi:hypothetical protein